MRQATELDGVHVKAEQLAEKLLDSPAAKDGRFSSSKAWIFMLPLLEEPYSEVERDWPGVVARTPALSALPSLRMLVESTLVDGWRHWRDRAAGWVAQGFPLDAELAVTVRELSKDGDISQAARHAAFAAVVAWERASGAGKDS